MNNFTNLLSVKSEASSSKSLSGLSYVIYNNNGWTSGLFKYIHLILIFRILHRTLHFTSVVLVVIVGLVGLEPTPPKGPAPKAGVSTNSTTDPILVTGTYNHGQLTHQLLTFPTCGLLGVSTFGIFPAFPFVLLTRFELVSPP